MTLTRRPAWRQYGWIAATLITAGALLIAVGLLTFSSPGLPSPASAEPTFTDPATKALFLQARYDWNTRTSDGLARAAREFSEVIGRDPRVAASYVGLAETYLLLREDGSMPDRDAYGRAAAAAAAAAALAPQSAEAHRALAFIAFWSRQDRVAARREFARAIALKPNDPQTHHWFATALLANGETAAALREISAARDLDPTATSVLADQGLILYCAGRRGEGLAMLRALAREQPEVVGPHRALADIALAEGRADEFLSETATVARLRGDPAQLVQATRWQSGGTAPGVVEATMLRDARAAHTGWFPIAQLSALAGDRAAAGAALGHACQAREPAAISAPSDLWLAHALSPATSPGGAARRRRSTS